jgi:glycine/D-amino acid oxidase-like deaminating enzyme/nitrite reductase/ring-hydroxylating ferredoxin subunit
MPSALPLPFRSWWALDAKGAGYPQLDGSLHAETVVVGAGIVGLTTALRLAEAGREVIVVEAMQVGRQVSGGSTAKVTAQHGLIYDPLIRSPGRDKAMLYAEANRAGMQQIAGWIDALEIACDFEAKAAYLYAESIAHVAQLNAEAEAASSLGFAAEFLDRAPLPFATVGAVRFDDQAQFNPVKYLDALAAAVMAKGGRIFEHSRVRLVEAASRWRVVTDRGNVHAEHVVVATNLPIKSPVGMAGRTQPRMHTAMAFPIEPGRIDGMFLGIDEPAHSLRTAPGPNGPVLIALGPKFKTGQEGDVAARFAELAAWINRNLTSAAPIAAWCNEDYDTEDAIPFIGEPDPVQSPGFHIATGFNAWGISNGTAGGMMIADTIMGRANPWRTLYDPTRPASKEFNNGGESRSLVAGIDAIGEGQGGVIDRNGEKVAVWRDDQGQTTELSAKCTHKGCIVSWNNAAKTWDCPCHGSIFSAAGEVLHGPARKNLQPATKE